MGHFVHGDQNTEEKVKVEQVCNGVIAHFLNFKFNANKKEIPSKHFGFRSDFNSPKLFSFDCGLIN